MEGLHRNGRPGYRPPNIVSISYAAKQVNNKCPRRAQICILYKNKFVSLYNIPSWKRKNMVILYRHKEEPQCTGQSKAQDQKAIDVQFFRKSNHMKFRVTEIFINCRFIKQETKSTIRSKLENLIQRKTSYTGSKPIAFQILVGYRSTRKFQSKTKHKQMVLSIRQKQKEKGLKLRT